MKFPLHHCWKLDYSERAKQFKHPVFHFFVIPGHIQSERDECLSFLVIHRKTLLLLCKYEPFCFCLKLIYFSHPCPSSRILYPTERAKKRFKLGHIFNCSSLPKCWKSSCAVNPTNLKKMLLLQPEHEFILCSGCISEFIAVIIQEIMNDIFGWI